MIINDLHFMGAAVFPLKANAPLQINPDRKLTPAIPRKHLQTITWRAVHIVKLHSGMQQRQFSARHPFYATKAGHRHIVE